MSQTPEQQQRSWRFLTSHAHVLVRIARQPNASAREIAAAVGITERQAQRIVKDLLEGGYLRSERRGRRKLYQLQPGTHLRHPDFERISVDALLATLTQPFRDPR